MAEYNEAQIWSAIHCKNHPQIPKDKRTIDNYMPIIEELFPGIVYYSVSGFNQVMRDYVQPTLSKLFPDLSERPSDKVSRDKIVNVETFLPSNGYEHLENPKWKMQLETLLE